LQRKPGFILRLLAANLRQIAHKIGSCTATKQRET
jgi:hypothetical protein